MMAAQSNDVSSPLSEEAILEARKNIGTTQPALSTADSTRLDLLEKLDAITESTSRSTHASRKARKAERQNRRAGRLRNKR